jgi:hypothetical protein
MKKVLVLSILLLSAKSVVEPMLVAVPADGYAEAYEYAERGIDVIAAGPGFCIILFDDTGGKPVSVTGEVDLGRAGRSIFIVESNFREV